MKKISFLDQLGYYILVILTMGGAWLIKTIIVKAIVDSSKNER